MPSSKAVNRTSPKLFSSLQVAKRFADGLKPYCGDTTVNINKVKDSISEGVESFFTVLTHVEILTHYIKLAQETTSCEELLEALSSIAGLAHGFRKGVPDVGDLLGIAPTREMLERFRSISDRISAESCDRIADRIQALILERETKH